MYNCISNNIVYLPRSLIEDLRKYIYLIISKTDYTCVFKFCDFFLKICSDVYYMRMPLNQLKKKIKYLIQIIGFGNRLFNN